ncbi:MAG: alpha/beta hydrolase [Acidobacteriota bacterium]
MAPTVLAHRVEHGDRASDDALVLLLNGGFMTAVSWQPVAATLLEHRGLLRCDFRGQLLTPGPAHARVEDNVDDVVALLDHLGLARVHVVGTSFGGLVAVHLATRHPERVASLAVVTVADHATAAMFDGADELRRVVAAILDGGERTAFHELLVRDVYSAAYAAEQAEVLAERGRQVAALPDAWFAATGDLVAAIEDYDLRPHLGDVRCPTLVVVAGDDRVMPPAACRALAAGIDGAVVVEHPTSGHALVTEDPEWLAERLQRFLAEQSSSPGS